MLNDSMEPAPPKSASSTEVTKADLVDRQLSQILEPDLPRTKAGKNIRKMLEGDKTLLQKLSLELEVAQNKDQSWAVPRLVIGKVKDSASSRPTKDEPTWYGLFVRSGTSDRDPVQACICRMKKDKTQGWILESGEDEMTTDKDVQRGIFDERLAVSYWHKREDDGSGKKTAAYLDAGVQKGQVSYLYSRFLVRLWASKLSTAKIPSEHIAARKFNPSGAKRVRESISEDEPSSAKKRRCERDGSICSPQAGTEDDEDDEEVKVEVKTEDDEEVKVKIKAEDEAEDERLSKECGWREDWRWWRAYNMRDENLRRTSLDNKFICEKIRRGLQMYIWDGRDDFCPIQMPGHQLLREAWEWAERQGAGTRCLEALCLQQWKRDAYDEYESRFNASKDTPAPVQSGGITSEKTEDDRFYSKRDNPKTRASPGDRLPATDKASNDAGPPIADKSKTRASAGDETRNAEQTKVNRASSTAATSDPTRADTKSTSFSKQMDTTKTTRKSGDPPAPEQPKTSAPKTSIPLRSTFAAKYVGTSSTTDKSKTNYASSNKKTNVLDGCLFRKPRPIPSFEEWSKAIAAKAEAKRKRLT